VIRAHRPEDLSDDTTDHTLAIRWDLRAASIAYGRLDWFTRTDTST